MDKHETIYLIVSLVLLAAAIGGTTGVYFYARGEINDLQDEIDGLKTETNDP